MNSFYYMYTTNLSSIYSTRKNVHYLGYKMKIMNFKNDISQEYIRGPENSDLSSVGSKMDRIIYEFTDTSKL